LTPHRLPPQRHERGIIVVASGDASSIGDGPVRERRIIGGYPLDRRGPVLVRILNLATLADQIAHLAHGTVFTADGRASATVSVEALPGPDRTTPVVAQSLIGINAPILNDAHRSKRFRSMGFQNRHPTSPIASPRGGRQIWLRAEALVAILATFLVFAPVYASAGNAAHYYPLVSIVGMAAFTFVVIWLISQKTKQ